MNIAASQDSMNDQLSLLPCERLDCSVLHSLHDYKEVAGNHDTLQAVELCVSVWIKQIRQVPIFSNL